MPANPVAARSHNAKSSMTIEVTAQITVSHDELDEVGASIVQQLQAIVGSGSKPGIRVRRRPIAPPSEVAHLPDPATRPEPRVKIHPASRVVIRDGVQVALTKMEFDLLLFLAQRPQKVHNRQEILRAVWGYEHTVSTRTIDVHIRRLRRKLGNDLDLITTVRGVGYRFDATDEVVIDSEGVQQEPDAPAGGRLRPAFHQADVG